MSFTQTFQNHKARVKERTKKEHDHIATLALLLGCAGQVLIVAGLALMIYYGIKFLRLYS